LHVSALIAAGGRGLRFGAAQPKQFLMLGGRSILERAVDVFRASDAIDDVVVALPPELAANPPAWSRRASRSRSSPAANGGRTPWRTPLPA
jgi:2-C-methyl-D-erythritol 4-phosphate cytidylyltransferase